MPCLRFQTMCTRARILPVWSLFLRKISTVERKFEKESCFEPCWQLLIHNWRQGNEGAGRQNTKSDTQLLFSHVLYPQIYQKKITLKKRLTWWFFYSAGILLHCHTSYLLIPVCMHELTIRKYLLVDIYV